MKPCPFDHIRRVTLSRWALRGQRDFRGGVSTDSRSLGEGDLFIAIRGATFDGNAFVIQAVSAGASGVIVDQPLEPAVLAQLAQTSATVMQADNSIRALNRLAAAYRREMRSKVIAVGGSNGKTTTKQIIHTLLKQKYSGIASAKSFNNNIGLPLTLLAAEPSHDYVVLEVGTNAPGEVAALGATASPDITVITSVGLEHLEKLGDLKSVAAEEASLARFTSNDGMLFFNKADPELLSALRLGKMPRVTVGPAGSEADIEVTQWRQDISGLNFTLNGRADFYLPLLGSHNVFNAALAIGVARRMGLSEAEIQAGLALVRPSPMRLEPQTVGSHWVLNDAYNSNPTSAAMALQTFAELEPPMVNGRRPRRVVVLADMLELGAGSAEHHVRLGELVAELKFDVLVTIGPLAHWAAEPAGRGGVKTFEFADVSGALENQSRWLGTGEAILLKGSRAMRLETLLSGKSAGTVKSAPLAGHA